MVLIDWYLPGTRAGGPVRSVYSLVNLLKDHFDFYVVTTNTDLGTNKPYDSVTADTLFEKDGVHYYYFSRGALNGVKMRKVIQMIAPDLVYLNSFWSYYFSILPLRLKALRLLRIPVLLAPRGMLSSGALGLKSLKKKAFISLTRLMRWHRGIWFHATTSREEEEIISLFPSARVCIAPNVNALKPVTRIAHKTPGHLRLFYLSRIATVKNLHYALEVLVRCPADLNIEYDIYGNIEETAYWDKCRELIATLPRNVAVHYRGEIPFDRIQQQISEYHALFLPTLNENFGHSIVESLLSGCLVIISDQTPWNDVESSGAGFALPLADQSAFVSAVAAVARMNGPQFAAASAKAIDYISNKIDFAKAIVSYEDMFNGCIENQSRNIR